MHQDSFIWIVKPFCICFCIFRSLQVFNVCPAFLMGRVVVSVFCSGFQCLLSGIPSFSSSSYEAKSSLVKEGDQGKCFLRCGFPVIKDRELSFPYGNYYPLNAWAKLTFVLLPWLKATSPSWKTELCIQRDSGV